MTPLSVLWWDNCLVWHSLYVWTAWGVRNTTCAPPPCMSDHPILGLFHSLTRWKQVRSQILFIANPMFMRYWSLNRSTWSRVSCYHTNSLRNVWPSQQHTYALTHMQIKTFDDNMSGVGFIQQDTCLCKKCIFKVILVIHYHLNLKNEIMSN